MTIQLSDAVRNAMLDQYETTIGTAPGFRIRTGTQPANCGASRLGTILASMTLPSDWMNAASGGSKTKLGSWQDASADNPGVAGHYEVMNTALTVCHEQGSCSATGGGGDLELDNTNIASGQTVTVTTFTRNAGNP